jgi:hypothetical protein
LALFGLPAISASGVYIDRNPSIVDAPLTTPPGQDFPITITRDGDLSADLDVYYNITAPTIVKSRSPVPQDSRRFCHVAHHPRLKPPVRLSGAFVRIIANLHSDPVSSPVAMTSARTRSTSSCKGSSTTVTQHAHEDHGGNVPIPISLST